MVFDPATQQQQLAFNFTLHVALPQLLQQLLEFHSAAGASGAAGLAGVAGVSSLLPDANVGMAPPPISPPVLPPVIPAPAISPAAAPPLPSMPPSVNVDVPRGDINSLAMLGPSTQAPAAVHGLSPKSPVATSFTVPPPMNPAELPLNSRLVMALQESNLTEVRSILQQQADVNFIEQHAQAKTPLYRALESGGNIDIVNALMQARAHVNAASQQGRTPLHFAIQQYSSLSPTILRMLLCGRADLMIPDSQGATSLDGLKMVALQSRQNSRLSASARQLLNEVTEQSTVAVSVIDAKEVRSAQFGDMQNDKIVFYTESSVGLYSLHLRRVIFIKRLRQLQATSFQHLAVNPWLGTIAVLLEIEAKREVEVVQNVCILWPNGQIQDEEPLKLSMQIGRLEGRTKSEMLPATIILSKNSQNLVSRLCDGQVFCWQLNAARCQVVSEKKLTSRGGLIAASSNGFWIAVVNQEADNGGQIEIWSYESTAGRKQDPCLVMNLKKRPSSLAVAESSSNTSCLLALVEVSAPGLPVAPIEVFTVDLDNTVTSLYRVRQRAPCHTLSFCHGQDGLLLSGDTEGVILIHDPSQNKHSMYHDNPGIQSICISVDRTLIVTTEANYLRVFRAPHAPS